MSEYLLTKPTVTIFTGMGGSGKTVVGKEVTRRVSDMVYLDKDAINQAFLRTPNPESKGRVEAYNLGGHEFNKTDDYYHDHVKLQTHRLMLEMARDNATMGKHSIINGIFGVELRTDYVGKIVLPFLRDLDYKFKMVLCDAPEEVIKERIRKRLETGDKLTAHWDALVLSSDANWQKFYSDRQLMADGVRSHDHVVIDTTKSLEECAKEVIRHLAR